jgi:hypothetical protein
MASQEPSPKTKQRPSNTYLKYSGLAFQLFGAIAIMGWVGYKIDQYMEIKFPAFTLLFCFLAFGGMMFQIYRSIKKDNP